MDRWIDLRSDTMTRPTSGMRDAMYRAEVGDDVFHEDPTVNRLEARAAALLGKEAAVFTPTGTQANLMALMSHCGRGDEYLVSQQAHTYRNEGGGAAVLGSIQPQPIEPEADATLDLAKVAANIKPEGLLFARTRLLALENTTDGKVIPLGYHAAAWQLTRERGLGLHLDGARLFNAAIALSISVAEIAVFADTVSVCLSKGLGAPAGSVLAGPTGLIDDARRWRKMLGGGMRQAGILAAAGLHALDHHVDRLAEDHANAARLAEGLRTVPGIGVDGAHTNMVFVTVPVQRGPAFADHLAASGIKVSGTGPSFRMVTHLDVTAADVEHTIVAVALF